MTRFCLMAALLTLAACAAEPAAFSGAENEVRIMTLAPGHFHAGLVHKYDYTQVDPVVHVYAPDGPEVDAHLALVERFNTRVEEPTQWRLEVYRGPDYLERMLQDKPGNVGVVAGNNGRKIDYIQAMVGAGIHVLADKPMIIHPDRFADLTTVLDEADARGLVVADIMTERHAITSVLQKELSRIPELFGELEPGSPEDPAITKESVHFFYKTVAGAPLVRPPWFFDVTQQGEAIADVSTHLVDLILWQVFPGEGIDYREEADRVEVLEAEAWNTEFSPEQFERVTGLEEYPDYLRPYLADSILGVAANGAFTFGVRGVHGRVSVRWGYTNPGGGDTHFSRMRGTKADLVVRQDSAQGFRATLYVEPHGVRPEFAQTLAAALEGLADYEGLTARPGEYGYEILIPDAYVEGHEDHFTRVTQGYLEALEAGSLPEWERLNLRTKYYVTTQAYSMSR